MPCQQTIKAPAKQKQADGCISVCVCVTLTNVVDYVYAPLHSIAYFMHVAALMPVRLLLSFVCVCVCVCVIFTYSSALFCFYANNCLCMHELTVACCHKP